MKLLQTEGKQYAEKWNNETLFQKRRFYFNRLKRAKYPYEKINVKETKDMLSKIGIEIKKRNLSIA